MSGSQSRNRASSGGPAVLIGLPFDRNSSLFRGSAEAPAALRKALYSPATTLWTETGTDLSEGRLMRDAGDLDLGTPTDPFSVIEDAAEKAARTGDRPIFIGGDHSVTYPVIRGLGRVHPDLTVLDFDAHPDLYDDLDGNTLSHACPFARIMERGLIKRLVQIGVRNVNGHQRKQARRFGVEFIEMKDFDNRPGLTPDGPVYISFDLDALDPAFAPGVSHPEPGGLTTRQALAAIQGIRAPVVGADVVELNPTRDPSGISAAAAAKLVKEIAGIMVAY